VHKPNPHLRVNPGGVLSPGQIVGRDAFIASIWRNLEQQSVLLTSERRMGKTSVMRKMKEEPPLRICPIQRSLQGINTPEEFARALVADVESSAPEVLARPFLKRLRKAGVKRVGAKSVEVEFEPVTEEAWKDVVTETFGTIDSGIDEKVVFLWDELPHMISAIEAKRGPDTARDVLDVLRYGRETYPSIRMILSGSIGIHHVVDKLRLKGGSWAPTNDVATVDVPPLDSADATYLAIELLRNESIECEGEKVDLAGAIASLVDFVPFYIHHVIGQLQQRQQSSDRPVDEVNAIEIIEGVLVDPDDPLQLKHYVDRVPVYYPQETELAYAVLDTLASNPEGYSLSEIKELLSAHMPPPAEERLHDLLQLLCKDHYLEVGYRFRLELVRRAWKAKRPF
jgi:hypothetical protein